MARAAQSVPGGIFQYQSAKRKIPPEIPPPPDLVQWRREGPSPLTPAIEHSGKRTQRTWNMLWQTELKAMSTALAGTIGANCGEANLTHCAPPPPP